MRTTRDYKAFLARHCDRRAKLGLELEERVATILKKMVVERVIDSFIHHPQFSPEDCEGRDFTVTRDGVDKSFGVTISPRKKLRGEIVGRFPDFTFPLETKDETIQRRILSLF